MERLINKYEKSILLILKVTTCDNESESIDNIDSLGRSTINTIENSILESVRICTSFNKSKEKEINFNSGRFEIVKSVILSRELS